MSRLFSVLAVSLAMATLTLASCAQNAEPPGTTHAAAATPAPPPAAAQSFRPNPRFLAADLPLLPEGVERGVRPVTVVQAGYQFAAQHPEVLNYIPCFCGCERGGHKGNHDCFVSGRDAAGKVTSWEPHAIVCEVCLDVAYQSMQMHNSGASTAAIRDAIEKKFAGAKFHTPTPMPKRGGAHD
jgi:Protein of unknown function with PCYCGC motif